MQIPELSRRSIIALVAVIAGIVAITLALLGGSGSSDGATGGSGTKDNNQAIDPVDPIDPNDADADNPKDLLKSANPLSPLADPFATSFGGNFKHKVTVRVSADTALRYGVRFRDGFEDDKIVTGGATITRTVTGGFPLAQVGMRTAPNSSRGTCSITIDGVQVSSYTTHKRLGVVVCTG
jgi:hypothetical protein